MLSHFISHKTCSLWSWKLLQLSALGKAGQAGSCPHTNAQSPVGALAEGHSPTLLPGAWSGKQTPQPLSPLYRGWRVQARQNFFLKPFLELLHKGSSVRVTDPTPLPSPASPLWPRTGLGKDSAHSSAPTTVSTFWITQYLLSQDCYCSPRLGDFLSYCTASSSHPPPQRWRPSSLCLNTFSSGRENTALRRKVNLPVETQSGTWDFHRCALTPHSEAFHLPQPSQRLEAASHPLPELLNHSPSQAALLIKPASSCCSSFTIAAPISTSITSTANQVEMSLLQLRSSSLIPHLYPARKQLPLNAW